MGKVWRIQVIKSPLCKFFLYLPVATSLLLFCGPFSGAVLKTHKATPMERTANQGMQLLPWLFPGEASAPPAVARTPILQDPTSTI